MFSLLTLLALSPTPPPSHPVCPAAQGPTDKPGTSAFVAGTDGFVFRFSPDLTPPTPIRQPNLDLLALFTAVLQERGTRLVLAPLPPRGLVHSDKVDRADPIGATFDAAALKNGWSAYLQQLRSTGARVADAAAEPLDGPFYFPADSHWSTAGAKAGGRAIAKELADLPAPRRIFTSTEQGTVGIPDFMGQKVAQLCDRPVSPSGRFPTFRRDPAAGSLTEELRPEIVLAGTSNSNVGFNDNVNFAGWIQEHSGLSVLNYGVVAGGAETSMLSVFRDTELWKTAPLALVWEVPTSAPFTDSGDLREFIALMEPPCTAANALAEGRGLADGSPVLTLPATQKISGTGWYVHVETDPTLLKYIIDLNHGIKSPDRISVNRANRIEQNGVARALLNPVRPTPLQSISVISREGGKTPPVTVRICPTTSRALRQDPVADGTAVLPGAP